MNLRKYFKLALVASVLFCTSHVMADVTQEGQSTEGKDFWITFLQADQDANNALAQSLSFSSREDCEVTIKQPFTGWDTTFTLNANSLQQVELYNGNVLTTTARTAQALSGKVCYAVNSQKVDTCALHITATANISMFATSYKKATFDATNVIPTASLKDNYLLQMYSPSDHGMDNSSQGSHFAIIAAEDNVVVDYCPTVTTQAVRNAKQRKDNGYDLTQEDSLYLNWQLGDTLTTPVLMKGQVFYVWTGKADWKEGDLSGTSVVARDGKKIAVFQGCPHTNIPYDVKERDHIFSQAMPTQYWGNTFVLTASNGRKRDVYRILALNDETEVRINGNLVHTFDFVNGGEDDKKQFYEFELGDNSISVTRSKGTVPVIAGKSCLVETSCPCAVHQFMASKKYDGVDDGDPAMLWVNPIEQQIDQVTFATYASKNGTTAHNVNIVTSNPDSMYLDGQLMPRTDFQALAYNKGGLLTYYYAQKSLGSEASSHTLKNTEGSFIAHVYGFTSNESYGFSAGGATKPLTQYITINGKIFTPESDNSLCGEDTVNFACFPDYEYEKITWCFGDSSELISGAKGDTIVTTAGDSIFNIESVKHYYPISGVYPAYVLIARSSSNICKGQNLVDSIPIKVNIGRFEFVVDSVEVLPCKREGQDMTFKMFYTNKSGVSLEGDSVTIDFNEAAKQNGFQKSDLVVEDKYFLIKIPDNAQSATLYGIKIIIRSDCGGADTTLNFQLNYDTEILTQRFEDVMGLLQQPFEGHTLSDFTWYKDSVLMPNEVSANLRINEPDYSSEYYVCFTIDKGTAQEVKSCSCPKKFHNEGKQYQFGSDVNMISATPINNGEKIFVNASAEATAMWISASGQKYEELAIPAGGRTINVPADPGLYILRVTTDKKSRNFKFVIQ